MISGALSLIDERCGTRVAFLVAEVPAKELHPSGWIPAFAGLT